MWALKAHICDTRMAVTAPNTLQNNCCISFSFPFSAAGTVKLWLHMSVSPSFGFTRLSLQTLVSFHYILGTESYKRVTLHYLLWPFPLWDISGNGRTGSGFSASCPLDSLYWPGTHTLHFSVQFSVKHSQNNGVNVRNAHVDWCICTGSQEIKKQYLYICNITVTIFGWLHKLCYVVMYWRRMVNWQQ